MAIIYTVHSYFTNNEDYDSEITADYIICAFSTKEKAKEYIMKLPCPKNNPENDEEPWEERNPFPNYPVPHHIRHFCQKHYYDEGYDEKWYEIDELKFDEEI